MLLALDLHWATAQQQQKTACTRYERRSEHVEVNWLRIGTTLKLHTTEPGASPARMCGTKSCNERAVNMHRLQPAAAVTSLILPMFATCRGGVGHQPPAPHKVSGDS